MRDKGKGGLIAVGGKWKAQISLGKDPATGRKRYSSRRFTSQRQAEGWLRDNRDRAAVSTSGSTGELFDLWLTSQAHRHRHRKISASTLDWYSSRIEKHLRQPLDKQPASKVTSAQLQKFMDTRTGLGESSLRRLTIILRAVFAYATKEGFITRNPALGLEVTKIETSYTVAARVWTVEQLRGFLEVTKASPLGPLWWLLSVSGMRRGEALGLRWDDVTFPDIGSPSIEVRRAYVNLKGKAVYGELKTEKSARRFNIDPQTAGVLTALRDSQQEAFGEDWSSAWPLFMRPDLKPFNPNFVTRTFQDTATRLGLPTIGPHGLRHSLASALGEAKVPLLTVSRLLGHSSTRVTDEVYSHVFAETTGEAVAVAAERLRGA